MEREIPVHHDTPTRGKSDSYFLTPSLINSSRLRSVLAESFNGILEKPIELDFSLSSSSRTVSGLSTTFDISSPTKHQEESELLDANFWTDIEKIDVYAKDLATRWASSTPFSPVSTSSLSERKARQDDDDYRITTTQSLLGFSQGSSISNSSFPSSFSSLELSAPDPFSPVSSVLLQPSPREVKLRAGLLRSSSRPFIGLRNKTPSPALPDQPKSSNGDQAPTPPEEDRNGKRSPSMLRNSQKSTRKEIKSEISSFHDMLVSSTENSITMFSPVSSISQDEEEAFLFREDLRSQLSPASPSTSRDLGHLCLLMEEDFTSSFYDPTGSASLTNWKEDLKKEWDKEIESMDESKKAWYRKEPKVRRMSQLKEKEQKRANKIRQDLARLQKTIRGIMAKSDAAVQRIVERSREFIKKAVEEYKTYYSWHSSSLRKKYRDYWYMKIRYLASGAAAEKKKSRLLKWKIGEIQTYLDKLLGYEITSVPVEIFDTPALSKQEILANQANSKALDLKVKALKREYLKERSRVSTISQEDRISKVRAFLEDTRSESPFPFHPIISKYQDSFEEILLDERTKEGKRIAKLKEVIQSGMTADPTVENTNEVLPEDIVAFIDQFVDQMAVDWSLQDQAVKLRLYTIRTVYPCIYPSIMKNTEEMMANDSQFFRICRYLRTVPTARLELDSKIVKLLETQNRLDISKAVNDLEGLSWQMNPIDALRCLQNALKATTQIAISSGLKEIGADDLLPLFIYIVIYTDLPMLHSMIHFMEKYTTHAEKLSELGYSLTTFQVAVTHILKYPEDDSNIEFIPKLPLLPIHSYDENTTEEENEGMNIKVGDTPRDVDQKDENDNKESKESNIENTMETHGNSINQRNHQEDVTDNIDMRPLQDAILNSINNNTANNNSTESDPNDHSLNKEEYEAPEKHVSVDDINNIIDSISYINNINNTHENNIDQSTSNRINNPNHQDIGCSGVDRSSLEKQIDDFLNHTLDDRFYEELEQLFVDIKNINTEQAS